MVFPQLTEKQRALIAGQIAELIADFAIEGRLGEASIPPGLGVFESCRELILDLPRQWQTILDAEGPGRMKRWIRKQSTWYHQLQTAETPFGFARSIEGLNSPDGSGHRVIEVVPSLVAREFQEAIRSLDEEAPNAPSEGEPTVCLLHVPRFAFYGLAIETDDSISLIYPFFRDRLKPPGLEMGLRREPGREPLRDLLERCPSVFGALGGPDRRRSGPRLPQ